MVIIHETRFESTQAGSCIVGVTCEKCNCEYFFELSRLGTGGGSAIYGIGRQGAADRAASRSLDDLQVKLGSEAELVPCPECNWINQELVQGYRLGRFNGIVATALGIWILGVAGSLFCAWFIAVGTPSDRHLWPAYAFGGTAFFTLLVGLAFALRFCLRRLIQPNKSHPRVPRTPRGTPPALIWNADRNQLVPAKPEPKPTDDDWVDFNLERDALPPMCCGCMNKTDPDQGYKLLGSPVPIVIPQCKKCSKALTLEYAWKWWLVFLGGTGLAALVFTLIGYETIILTILTMLLMLAVASFVAWKWSAPVKFRTWNLERGIITFRFRNRKYREAVVSQATNKTRFKA